MVILAFFVGHWVSSVFFQTFFLHRYGAHKQFTMCKGWERFFHLFTYVTQGSSFLSRARLRDPAPHAPRVQRHAEGSALAGELSNVFTMMWATKQRYDAFAYRREQPEPRFDEGHAGLAAARPLSQRWPARVAVAARVHALLLRVRDALVDVAASCRRTSSWARSTARSSTGAATGTATATSTATTSRATRSCFDFLTLGELFQNNHHKYAMRPNFAVRSFELDPTYQVMRVLNVLGIIKLRPLRELDEKGELIAPGMELSDGESVETADAAAE